MRTINDSDYISFLKSPLYQKRYLSWKNYILENLDSILFEFSTGPVETVMEKYNLSPRDVALMVRLHFVTDEEVAKFKLDQIEAEVPR